MIPLAFAPRFVSARAAMAEAGLDYIVVHNLANIRWLTGFGGSNATMAIGPETAWFVTDGRYDENASGLLADLADQGERVELTIARSDVEQVLADLVAPTVTVGFEAEVVTYAVFEQLAAAFGADRLESTTSLITACRQVKDRAEVERIEAAADIADAAFASVVAQLQPGLTERTIAATLNFEMLSRGAAGLSFDTIVASGPNSALPHAEPSMREVADGDLIVFDFGAAVDGYGSDMTRTVCVGSGPSPEQREIYDVVAAAQEAGVQAVAVGVATAEVDRVCRSIIADAGYGDRFIHGTGHSLGLEIHEAPFLSASSKDILEHRMVVTVEPGIYVPGLGGVRIEDTVLVDRAGPRRLTKAEKGI